MTGPEYLTPDQAAALLPRFNADWIRRELRAGRLEGTKVGGSWLTTREAIEKRLASGSNSTRRRRRRDIRTTTA